MLIRKIKKVIFSPAFKKTGILQTFQNKEVEDLKKKYDMLTIFDILSGQAKICFDHSNSGMKMFTRKNGNKTEIKGQLKLDILRMCRPLGNYTEK